MEHVSSSYGVIRLKNPRALLSIDVQLAGGCSLNLRLFNKGIQKLAKHAALGHCVVHSKGADG